jgi:hypothetical protein
MQAPSVNAGGACVFVYDRAVRMLLTLVALAALGAGGYLAYPKYIAPRLGLPAPPVAAPAGKPAPTADEQQKCLDACEQKSIVGQTPEAEMRACRASCGNRTAGAARKPNEPIRSISRAPADHGRAPPTPRSR